jgi:hypothetical protein
MFQRRADREDAMRAKEAGTPIVERLGRVSAIAAVPGLAYGAVLTSPPTAPTSPVRNAGIVSPRAAAPIAAGLWTCTMPPTSGRRA